MNLSTIGLEGPNDFPTQSYEKIHATMVLHKDAFPDKWSEFVGTWKSVGIKFIALAQNDEIFTTSIKRGRGGASSYEDRYNQEYALFNFFVAGHSLLESLFYGLYIIASIKNPIEFPLTQKSIERVKPSIVRDKFSKNYETEQITKYITEILTSSEYKESKKIRNTLIHRTMPSRTIQLSTERAIPDLWMIGENIPTDEQLTASRRYWYSQVISNIMDKTIEFTDK